MALEGVSRASGVGVATPNLVALAGQDDSLHRSLPGAAISWVMARVTPLTLPSLSRVCPRRQ